MNSELYFPNGCNLCSNPVNLLEEKRVYECSCCGASVTYHHKTTDFSREYEPQGYLAAKEVNDLRMTLKNAIVLFWEERRRLQLANGIKECAPINFIYPKYLIKVNYLGDLEFGVSVEKKNDYTNVFLIDIGKHSLFEFSELELVSNREKTYVWLAEQLGIKAKNFKIGYLTKEQLIKAIEVCHEEQERINSFTASN